jgi:hypothetical protein
VFADPADGAELYVGLWLDLGQDAVFQVDAQGRL